MIISFFEKLKNIFGKSPEHQKNALKAHRNQMIQMGKVSIRPAITEKYALPDSIKEFIFHVPDEKKSKWNTFIQNSISIAQEIKMSRRNWIGYLEDTTEKYDDVDMSIEEVQKDIDLYLNTI